MSIAPGWYPDPDDANARRYWDGAGWSAPLPMEQPTAAAVPTRSESPERSAAREAADRKLREQPTICLMPDCTETKSEFLGLCIRHRDEYEARLAPEQRAKMVALREQSAVAKANLAESLQRAEKAQKRAGRLDRMSNSLENAQRRRGDDQIVCPHCQLRGRVTSRKVKQKRGISGGKATGALLTGGASMLATGLSRKEKGTEMTCHNCNTRWVV